MIEERIKNLIAKRDLKQQELENLRSQRSHRKHFSAGGEAHENSDVVVNKEIKLLEKSIAALNEVIEDSLALLNVKDGNVIGFGSTFNFSLENGFSKTITLVDKLVSDDDTSYITDKSPLGNAVKGKAEGDTFSYLTPNGIQMNGIINEIYHKQAKQK